MKKIVRNMDTESSQEFWNSAEENAAEVRMWPDWKRAGINVSDMRQDMILDAEGIEQMSMIGSSMNEPDVHSPEWEEMERLRQELKENEGVIKCLRRQRNEAETRVEELEDVLQQIGSVAEEYGDSPVRQEIKKALRSVRQIATQELK